MRIWRKVIHFLDGISPNSPPRCRGNEKAGEAGSPVAKFEELEGSASTRNLCSHYDSLDIMGTGG